MTRQVSLFAGVLFCLAGPAAADCGGTMCSGGPSSTQASGAPVSTLLAKCDRDANDCFWPVRDAIDAGACKPPPPYVVDGYLRNDGVKAALDWLRAHPEWNDKPSSEALKEAAKSLWPCR